MAKSAPPKRPSLHRKAVKLVVCLGSEGDFAPSAEDEVDYLHPLKIERAAGGQRVDATTLAYDLSVNNDRIIDTKAPKGVRRQAEVREVDPETGEVLRVLHWGKLSAQPVSIDSGGESIQFIIRTDRHLFGQPLSKVPFWDNNGETVIYLDKPLTFNPEIDETIKGNCSNKVEEDRDNMYCLFDAGGPETTAATTTHGQSITRWLVYEAVHTLCWLLNPDETHIRNPTKAYLQTALRDIDFIYQRLKNLTIPKGQEQPLGDGQILYQRLKNLTIPKGLFLPQALDALLGPFGASWYIEYKYDKIEDKSVRHLRFFTRDRDRDHKYRALWIQRPGEQLDPEKSNCPELKFTYDIANLANTIIGQTSKQQREVTIELEKGWPVDQDSIDRDLLLDDSDTKLAYPHAHLKWVANEHGAWTGLRPEITSYLYLGEAFQGDILITARRALPCLSRVSTPGGVLESRDLFLEWYNPDESAWQPVTGWAWSKLDQEVGIMFHKPPLELYDLVQTDPASARIRLTCTLEGDIVRTKTATPTGYSPNQDEVPLLLDLSDKFHDRDVCRLGDLESRFSADYSTADVRDDGDAMLDYLKRVQQLEDVADLSCSAILEGLDHSAYEISYMINDVNGRNISLRRDHPDPDHDPFPLQIMGITLDIQQQRTELLLESFEEEVL